jgi:putative heme-binding domain-containing protein
MSNELKGHHTVKLSTLGTGRRRTVYRISSVAACLWFVAVSAVWAADELPLASAPSKLHWIWTDPAADTTEPVVFEQVFVLATKPAGGRIRVMSHGGCAVSINGDVIGDQADVSRPKDLQIKGQLREGENKIRVEAKRGAKANAVVLTMIVTDTDGLRRRLETDGSWRVIPAGGQAVAAKELHSYEKSPWGDVFAELRPSVTKADAIRVPDGFQVELLHALDEAEGSWVAMCVDGKGRLIASDAGGRMVRITPPPIGGDVKQLKMEPIALPVGHANGLLWAFDSLYVMVCQEGVYEAGSGVYRVTDTDGDDVLDKVELLRKMHGSGDHGPHALLLSPDGKSITVVCGNSTRLTEIQEYRVPPVWKDDLAIPKLVGHGFMSGAGAPAGYIARMSPDGRDWTLAAVGLRNEYDAAFNRHGELFTYDADMEWDVGMPWYRPTRVCHVVDGAEFGWRSVSGKWPEYYVDSLPPVINVGRGSPTGVAFGYGAKFPPRYQEALFIADWTYGKLYAVHLKEAGATYSATQEVFVEGNGTKPTDIVVAPDGALYFAGGSRNSNSALYRVTYVGSESTAPSRPVEEPQAGSLRTLRHRLEDSYHATDEASLTLALECLSHDDRFLRFAARTLLEFRPVEAWMDRALALTHPRAIVQTTLALARLEKADAKEAVFRRWENLPLEKLDVETRLDAIRALQVIAVRLGDPEGEWKTKLLDKLHRAVPQNDERFNAEAGELLARWKSPLTAKLIFPLFEKAASQEEQMSYAVSLRLVADGWPNGAKETFFRWFLLEKFHKAGHLAKFIADMRKDAVALLTDEEKVALKPILDAAPENRPEPPLASRLFVKNWDTDELLTDVEPLLRGKRDLGRGKALYRETGCAACHLFRGEGGVTGPDLTLAANKFPVRELVTHIIEPSKVVSDQYAATLLELEDGTVITGRLVNNDPNKVQIQPNLYNPADVREFARKDIAEMRPSPVSLMPVGLLNTCQPDEAADLIAWIQSGLRAAIAAPPSIPIAGVPAPIAHWQFEDDDLEARDSAGKHPGTIHGATSHAGKFGRGLLFDRAKGNHVAIPYSPDFEIGTFTVSAWVWLTKEPTFSGIVGTRSGGEFTFDMKVNADKVHGDIGDGTRWINTAINFYKDDVGSNGQGGDLDIRHWYLITFVIDNDKKECRLYLNADRKNTISFQGEPRLMRPGQTMTIGNTGQGEFMDGVIDDVRIWKHALVDDQVQKLIAP